MIFYTYIYIIFSLHYHFRGLSWELIFFDYWSSLSALLLGDRFDYVISNVTPQLISPYFSRNSRSYRTSLPDIPPKQNWPCKCISISLPAYFLGHNTRHFRWKFDAIFIISLLHDIDVDASCYSIWLFISLLFQTLFIYILYFGFDRAMPLASID